MYINNELRDKAYNIALRLGFWDNVKTYHEFIENLLGEFDEALDELMNGKSPTEVYYKSGKPEGAPTELADILIFILDYAGGSVPKIEIDEAFLEAPDNYYKNIAHYERTRKIEPWKYFLEVKDICKKYASLSILSHALYGNNIYEDESGNKHGVPIELHKIIKHILAFCDIYGIDMEHELIAKLNYNSTRPRDYRKMGSSELLETNPNKVLTEMLGKGFGMYNSVDDIITHRQKTNAKVLQKRKDKLKAYILEDSIDLNHDILAIFSDNELIDIANNPNLSDNKKNAIINELNKREELRKEDPNDRRTI